MLFLLLNIDCGNRLDKADLNVHTKYIVGLPFRNKTLIFTIDGKMG